MNIVAVAHVRVIVSKKQNKHIADTNKYQTLIFQNKNPSIVTLKNEEIQNLVDKYAGTVRILRNKNENSTNIELIVSNENVEYTVNNEKQIKTNKSKIHYSKNGVHIIPTIRSK